MQKTAEQDLIALENRFWRSMVEQDTDTALGMLHEPSLMVSSHGAMQFDHAGYRQMAEHGSMVIKSFELDDMKVLFATDDTAVVTYHAKQTIAKRGETGEVRQEMNDSSVWTLKQGQWRCVMHTETPVADATH
jgi:hypothetical protein